MKPLAHDSGDGGESSSGASVYPLMISVVQDGISRVEKYRFTKHHILSTSKSLISTVALAASALAGCGSSTGTAPTIHQAPAQKQVDQPVQHVFVILKENHTYDNFFLSYLDPNEPSPPAQGLASNGRMITITEPSKDDWSPGDNSFEVAHVDFDGGIMDGFDQDAHQPDPTGLDRFLHADGSDGAYVSYGVTPEAGRRRVGY
jgi:hypothetical protein